MLARLLLVLLILAGQIPVRACACAAATDQQPAGSLPCEHDHTSAPTGVSDGSPVAVDLGHDHGDRHLPDCPAVNPRSAVAPTPTVHAEAIGADLAPATEHPALSLRSPCRGSGPVRHPPDDAPVPLFISLLVLQI